MPTQKFQYILCNYWANLKISMCKKPLVLLNIALYFSIAGLTSFCTAQSINTEFGKNRVQYHDDFKNWWQYESENFITYWYGKSRNVAIPSMQMAEADYERIQNLMEHRMNDKIEIIVYLDISDVKQSNIGTEETFENKTGETKIIGNKMFVYFNGNHQDLRKQIREGIANVFLNNMLFGSNFQEIIQNAVLMDIPEWFKKGIVKYASQGWNSDIENKLRDLWMNQPKWRNFKKLATEYPEIAGQSFWFYLEQQYGKSAITNLLYLTKISRGVDNSFIYVFNEDVAQVLKGWQQFMQVYFDNEKDLFENLQVKNLSKWNKRGKIPIPNLKLSPDGKSLIAVSNDRGKVRVHLIDVRSKKSRKLFSYGYINEFQETDYNYPLVAWHPDNTEISLIYEHRDVIRLIRINTETGQQTKYVLPEAFQRIYSISYVDSNNYVFSASMDGFSDLVLFRSVTRTHENLTTDYYDDLDAVVCNFAGEKGVLFASNRTETTLKTTKYDTILPVGNFGIFFLPLSETPDLKRLTTPGTFSLRMPIPVDDQKFTFLNEVSGIQNIYLYDAESRKSDALTNADRHVEHYSISSNGTMVYTYLKNQKYHTGWGNFIQNKDIGTDITPWQNLQQAAFIFDDSGKVENKDNQYNPDTHKAFSFQTLYPDPPVLASIKPVSGTVKDIKLKPLDKSDDPAIAPAFVKKFINSRAIAANKKFSLQDITTKMDNSILFEGLESYTGDRQRLLNNPMGFLVKANIKDLFEDFVIEAGMRLPVNLRGSEFFVVFDDLKKLIDRRFALYRKSQTYTNDLPITGTFNAPLRSRKNSFLGLYQWKYPFNIYKSFRATTSLRLDRYMRLSTENQSLIIPPVEEQRASLRLEYIYDNTHDHLLNIKFGTRYKIYGEFINKMEVNLKNDVKVDLHQGFTGIIGFDARHYIPVWKHTVLALRGAGAVSFGNEKMLYYLGGMENWLLPEFDQTIPERSDADFAYKANIGQMRGFIQNIRNGSSYLLTNTEIRIPIMTYLLGKNKGSAFFRNLQLTGFIDAGMAWHGVSPFSKENPLNRLVISNPPVITMEIQYFRDPLVMGTGVGLRTKILGYYLKCDYGWGIETRKWQKPVFYLSMGTDF